MDEAAACRPGAPEEDAVAVAVAAVVDVDLRDGDGLTQLMKSAYEGKADNVQWLLEQEVRVLLLSENTKRQRERGYSRTW